MVHTIRNEILASTVSASHRIDPVYELAPERWVPAIARGEDQIRVNEVLPDTILGRNIANQIIPIADFTRIELHEERAADAVVDTRYSGIMTRRGTTDH